MRRPNTCLLITLCLIFFGFGVTLSPQSMRTITGKVIDCRNRKGLPNVNISLDGTNIGTITNTEGKFIFLIPDNGHANVTFSTLGFTTRSIPTDSLMSDHNLIRLEKQPVELSEVVIYSGDPMKIISAAIKKIPENYSVNKDMLAMFYRETIRKGKRFIGVSEAAINV